MTAWELHFGASFLSVQKATLGSGACLLGAASVLQCHGVLLFRNRPLDFRPLELRCGAVLTGMGAALWSWFLVGSEGNVRQWSLLAKRRFRPSVPWCFAVSESPARTSLGSCFEGMGAALWSWFLVGSEGIVLAVFRKRCLPVGFLLEQPPAAAAAIKDF